MQEDLSVLCLSLLIYLADFPGQEIVALVRPSSVSKPGNEALKKRGVEIRATDLQGPQEKLVEALKDIDVLVSAIGPQEQLQQIPLATAAKMAGVKRFVPCGFITVVPAGGVMGLRDDVRVSLLFPASPRGNQLWNLLGMLRRNDS